MNREAAARFGINVADIADLIEVGIGGRAVATLFLGERKRYDIAVRFPGSVRSNPEEIGDLTLTHPGGRAHPAQPGGRGREASSESTITRETNRRHLTVKRESARPGPLLLPEGGARAD